MINACRAQRRADVKKSWVEVSVIENGYEVTTADKQDTTHIRSSVWLSVSRRPRRRVGYKRLQEAVYERYFSCERDQQNRRINQEQPSQIKTRDACSYFSRSVERLLRVHDVDIADLHYYS